MARPTRRLASNAPGPADAPSGRGCSFLRLGLAPQLRGRQLSDRAARRIEALGGLAAIVLTHRDGVADHHRWAAWFVCPRWIHAADAEAAPGAERILEDDQERRLGADLRLIPTPGHTAGSLVALLAQQILFSGDHLCWSEEAMVASRRYCWWNGSALLASVQTLRDLGVRWLLPGHSGRRAFAAGEWAQRLEQTLAFQRSQP